MDIAIKGLAVVGAVTVAIFVRAFVPAFKDAWNKENNPVSES